MYTRHLDILALTWVSGRVLISIPGAPKESGALAYKSFHSNVCHVLLNEDFIHRFKGWNQHLTGLVPMVDLESFQKLMILRFPLKSLLTLPFLFIIQ